METHPMIAKRHDELLTREEAARILRLKSSRTLLDWEKDGWGPQPTKISPRLTLYSRQDIDGFLQECRSYVSTAPGQPPLSLTQKAIVLAERRRCRTIIARAPKGYEAHVLTAISNGASIEEFDASLPGELQRLMPPLHAVLALIDAPKDKDAETAAQAILDAANLAR
jgi:predicted DNA-binding transcriptional regulator AlpA